IDAEVIEFIAQSGSDVTKKPIKDLGFPKDALIGGVVRGEDSFIATGTTEINSNDRVVVFCLPDAVKKVEKFFR
ncbi:MAG TPA: TrkA C-terminal domain-containing protein, partial [Ignavibacteriaceae bacterium]|nr:TrkA C-terminal domain-containing protein [Ignavibacteriaceae bacterium]